MTGSLTITSPASDSQAGYDSSTIPITWSFSGDFGATQVQRRVTVQRAGSSTNLADTGMQATTSTTYPAANLASGVYYIVTVSVLDTSGSTSTAQRTVVARYARGLPPTLMVFPTTGALGIAITNPTSGSRPAATSNRLYRRPYGAGGPWTLVTTTGPNTVVIDREVRSAGSYEYFARAEPVADSAISSAAAPTLEGMWVHDPTSAAQTERNWRYTDGGSEKVGIDEEVTHFVGRRYPVLESGTTEDQSVSVAVQVPHGPTRQSDIEWWRLRKRAGATLMFRDGRGRAFKAAIVGDLAVGANRAGSTVAVTLQRVDYPAAATLAASDYSTGVADDGGKGDGGKGLRGKGL